MEFGLSEAQRRRYAEVRDGARDRLGHGRAADDGKFSRDAWKVAASLGLTGLCLPTAHGGAGLGALDSALCMEAFGKGCRDTGFAFALAAHLFACAVPVRDFGVGASAAQLQTGMSRGDIIAANAMTEDDAGSDVGSICTSARRDGDVYVLDGTKSFVSNAPVANVIVTYAVTDASAGFLGLTGFAIPRDVEGLTVSEPLKKMGLHGCLAARVEFAGCRVPASYRLGGEGEGSAVFQHSMLWERACLFALYLGMMDDQLERCVAHARKRRQFGRAISQFQATSHRLAVMEQRLESARLLLYRACWILDQGTSAAAGAAALAKVVVSEAAVANSLDAVQLFGGAGYLESVGIEQQLRDAVPATILSGTTEIQRELMARELGL